MSDDLIPCACGCGTLITRLGKNKKPRRFLRGHQVLGRHYPRDEKYWELRLRKLHTRAPFCACGCGQRVLVTREWLERQSCRGNRKNCCVWIPHYIDGHMPQIPCACGCGQLIPLLDSRNQKRRYVPDHSGSAAKHLPTDWEAKALVWNAAGHLCGCGCGAVLERNAREMQMGRVPHFVRGHGYKSKVRLFELTPQELSIIYGGLLGDMSIGRPHPRSRPRLTMNHCLAQKEYVEDKIRLLQRLHWRTEERVSGGYKKGGLMFCGRSSCLEVLESVFEIVRPDGGPKKISAQWLEQIDDQGLAVWFMDDGSIGCYQDKLSTASLHTEGFSYADNLLLVDWLYSRGFKGVRVAKAKKYHYIYFPNDAAHQFCHRMAPYMHPSMAYKIRGL